MAQHFYLLINAPEFSALTVDCVQGAYCSVYSLL